MDKLINLVTFLVWRHHTQNLTTDYSFVLCAHTHLVPGHRLSSEQRAGQLHWQTFLVVLGFVLRHAEQDGCSISCYRTQCITTPVKFCTQVVSEQTNTLTIRNVCISYLCMFTHQRPRYGNAVVQWGVQWLLQLRLPRQLPCPEPVHTAHLLPHAGYSPLENTATGDSEQQRERWDLNKHIHMEPMCDCRGLST